MSIQVYRDSKIFIACPSNFSSGGPELLHQLCFHLIKDLGVNAVMYYYDFNPKKFKFPVHKDYISYDLPYILDIEVKEDDQRNILIVPEIFTTLLILTKIINIRRIVWFLSVDNYYFSKMRFTEFFWERFFNKIAKLFCGCSLFDIYEQEKLKKLSERYKYKQDKLLKLSSFYMTNSHRGLEWFVDLKPMYYLSEYLNQDFLKIKTDLSKKENIVAYNPKKGFTFTKKIIRQAPGIKFVPLINMSRVQMIETLQKSKVYIDFGNHPGKDRIPREAAILGCCVITGKRGSAAYFEDVPIQESYKFEDKDDNIPKIVRTIESCLENYEERVKDFEFYRKVIRDEPKKFIEDLKNTFKVIK